MSRKIPETPSEPREIDLDRVVVDPFYRREVLSQLRFDRLHPRDEERPAAVLAAAGKEH